MLIMKICGKSMWTKTGKRKGSCTRPLRHQSECGNSLCWRCCISDKEGPSGLCSDCRRKRDTEYNRKRGAQPKKYKTPGTYHTFPCGCAGRLPADGIQNKFVTWTPYNGFNCRVRIILISSLQGAKKYGHLPIAQDTPHASIRALMEEPNCERCGAPLAWEFGLWKTPHLHHNHETGEPLGFTHPVCNPRAMENEIDRLRAEVKRLK